VHNKNAEMKIEHYRDSLHFNGNFSRWTWVNQFYWS